MVSLPVRQKQNCELRSLHSCVAEESPSSGIRRSITGHQYPTFRRSVSGSWKCLAVPRLQTHQLTITVSTRGEVRSLSQRVRNRGSIWSRSRIRVFSPTRPARLCGPTQRRFLGGNGPVEWQWLLTPYCDHLKNEKCYNSLNHVPSQRAKKQL